MEKVYADSALDWLAIRPVTLKAGAPIMTDKPSSYYGLRSTITRVEIAQLMVDAVERTTPFCDHTSMIAG